MDKLMIILKSIYDLTCVVMPVAMAISCTIIKSDKWEKRWIMFSVTSGVIGLILGRFLPNVEIKDYIHHITTMILLVVMMVVGLIIGKSKGGD